MMFQPVVVDRIGVGGRNIGSEYFDADPALAFADNDLMAVGSVVAEVSAEFNDYWNSDSI